VRGSINRAEYLHGCTSYHSLLPWTSCVKIQHCLDVFLNALTLINRYSTIETTNLRSRNLPYCTGVNLHCPLTSKIPMQSMLNESKALFVGDQSSTRFCVRGSSLWVCTVPSVNSHRIWAVRVSQNPKNSETFDFVRGVRYEVGFRVLGCFCGLHY